MSTSTTSRTRHEFDQALDTLNALVAYARNDRDAAPASVPGLNEPGAIVLQRPDGREAARTWSLFFDDTIRLVREFKPSDDTDTAEVTAAVLRALAALTARLNGLGQRVQA